MENYILTLIFALPLIPIFYFSPERRKYFLLGVFTLLFALPFEIIAVSAGWWGYFATPQIFSVSVFTLLAYFPWMAYIYFSGNFLAQRLRLGSNLGYGLYGIFAMLYAGFLFDPVSVWLGYYAFHLHPQVFGVPWVVIAAEAACVMIVILLFEFIEEKLGNNSREHK